mmetsp:Transcript_6872/g.13147  ORF Transcript_6872/g.13147 Transcript_6872/m.13147 type:complete len:216 (-) Transcript_6872:78-725(-)
MRLAAADHQGVASNSNKNKQKVLSYSASLVFFLEVIVLIGLRRTIITLVGELLRQKMHQLRAVCLDALAIPRSHLLMVPVVPNHWVVHSDILCVTQGLLCCAIHSCETHLCRKQRLVQVFLPMRSNAPVVRVQGLTWFKPCWTEENNPILDLVPALLLENCLVKGEAVQVQDWVVQVHQRRSAGLLLLDLLVLDIDDPCRRSVWRHEEEQCCKRH